VPSRAAIATQEITMKTKVFTLDGDEELGEVGDVNDLIELLKKYKLTPDDIWFDIPNGELCDEILEKWEWE
jgi:predicted kinase